MFVRNNSTRGDIEVLFINEISLYEYVSKFGLFGSGGLAKDLGCIRKVLLLIKFI